MRSSLLKAAGRPATILAGLAAFISLVVAIGIMSTDPSKRAVQAKYAAINPGMTRPKVRQLVQGLGVVMFTGIGPVELMHIDDARFLIAIYYQPDPKDPTPTSYINGTPHDDWIVREKVFLELGRTGTADQMLTGFGLKPERSFDRYRMPE